MNIFIDCIGNGEVGDLISMALVADNDLEFYEVLEVKSCDMWVAKNVIPVLNKDETMKVFFRKKLEDFLNKFDSIHIIANWPTDIKHLCELLTFNKSICLKTPHITMEILKLKSNSLIPYNALEEARALRREFYK